VPVPSDQAKELSAAPCSTALVLVVRWHLEIRRSLTYALLLLTRVRVTPRQRLASDPSGTRLSPHCDLPVLTTNCSNNYGRFPISQRIDSLMVLKRAKTVKPAARFTGDGQERSRRLYVDDHAKRLRGPGSRRVGETLTHLAAVNENQPRNRLDHLRHCPD